MNDVLRYALAHLSAQRVLSFLLSLILAVGVAICVLVTGLVRAGGDEIQRLSFGPMARSLVIRDNHFVPHPYGPPTLSEFEAISASLGNRVTMRSAWRTQPLPVTSGHRDSVIPVHGVLGPVAEQLQLELSWGQMPTAQQSDRRDRVCVAGASAYRRLASDRQAGAINLAVNATPCALVGVLAPGRTRIAAQYNNAIFVPLQTASTYMFDAEPLGPEDVDQMIFVLASPSTLEATHIEVDQIIRTRRGVSQAHASPVTFRDPNSSVEVAVRQRDLLNSSLLFLAGATLLAAMTGYGASSFALARARRADFAIQLACGASPASLLSQTGVESAFIGLMGGVVGLVLGVTLTQLTGQLLNLDASLTLIDLSWPPMLGLMTGVLAGASGAFFSALTDPADSLRAV